MVNTSFTWDVQFPPLPIEEWEDTKNTLLPYSEFIKIAAKKLSRTGFLSSADFWVAIDKYGKAIQSQ